MFILSKKSIVFAASTLFAAYLTGCVTSSSGPSTADQHASDSTAALGTTNLSGELNELTSGQFQYGQGNLDSLKNANAYFEQALVLNPGNSQANFGAAITGVLLAAQTPGLSSEVNNTIDAGSPLNPILAKNAPSAKIAILRKVATQATRPEFHQIQDSVASVLLPALEKAITRLQAVYNDPAFSLLITVDGTVRKFGHAEVAVLLAGFKATHALSTLVLSYDIDIDHNGSYTYLDTIGNGDFGNFNSLSTAEKDSLNVLTTLLTPGSSFLAVKSDWQTKLAGVDGEIKSALAVLQAGLSSVYNQTGDQSADVLHLCSKSPLNDCINDSDFSSGLGDIDSAIKYMNQPLAVKVGATTVQVNVAAFFSVQDYKKMLPYYNFYNANSWDSAHPVIYFSATAGGASTGNLNTVSNILQNSTNTASTITQLKAVVYWQDPTFQGFLPGITTQAQVWNLVQQLADSGQIVLAKTSAASFMSPTFALSLLGTR